MPRLLFIVFALVLSGCCGRHHRLVNAEPEPSPTEQTTDARNHSFILSLLQYRPTAEDSGGWKLLVRTEQHFGCMNYTIKYTFRNQGGRMSLKLTDIVAPEICLTALGPAKCEVPLGVRLAAGRYELSVTLPNGEIVRGRLESDGVRMRLVLAEHPNVHVEEVNLNDGENR